jgi:ABC-type transport system involved in cytochrome bd biosynthesis fused ATPase/permease subunit
MICGPHSSLLDLIIVLKEGNVVEQGTHEELLAKRGLYYDMWTAQEDATAPLNETPESEPEGNTKSPST